MSIGVMESFFCIDFRLYLIDLIYINIIHINRLSVCIFCKALPSMISHIGCSVIVATNYKMWLGTLLFTIYVCSTDAHIARLKINKKNKKIINVLNMSHNLST